jgi:hypothetical protein
MGSCYFRCFQVPCLNLIWFKTDITDSLVQIVKQSSNVSWYWLSTCGSERCQFYVPYTLARHFNYIQRNVPPFRAMRPSSNTAVAEMTVYTVANSRPNHDATFIHLSRETEELQKHRLNNRRNVSNTLSKVSNKLVAITIDHLGVLRSLINLATSLVRRVRNAQHRRPLLKLFVSSLRAHKRISKTMGDQEAWALASVSRVRVRDEASPLLGSVRETLSTGLVGAEGSWVAL